MTEDAAPVGHQRWVPLFGEWHRLIISAGQVHRFDDGAWITLSKSDADGYRTFMVEYEQNPLQFFLPHGGGLNFVNDWENGIVMLTSLNRAGKSAHGVAFSLFRTINCDFPWHCYEYSGIKRMPWRGPRRLCISSYSWGNVRELWYEYRRWMPRKLLGRWAPNWGKYEGERGRQRDLSFTGREQRLELSDGSELVFLCDGQAQAAWEGKRWDDGHFDEQREREKFIGWLRGTANTPGLVQGAFTLTGHVLPDRADTGSGGWVHNDLWLGNYTFGKTIGRYKISVDQVPDAVLSSEKKAELYKQWVEEPRKNQNEEDMRKAEARYYGGWESGSGLVIDNYIPQHHIIPAYKRYHHIVNGTSKYRGMDHGLGRPGAAIWLEVFPWGDCVVYREYFQKGKTVPYHAKKIVELSGNTMQRAGEWNDLDTIAPYPIFSEVFEGERYRASVLDGRSFASPSQERQCSLGHLYQDCGLDCSAARGGHNFKEGGGGQVQKLKQFFTVIPDRVHIMTQFWKRKMISDDTYQAWLKGHDGNPRNGAHLYIVVDCRWIQNEIRQWRINPKTGLPEDKNDHLMAALKYVIAEDPMYFGSDWDDAKMIEEIRVEREREHSRFKYVRY